MANPIKTVGINDYEFYAENGYEYVVTSSVAYKSYIKENSNKSKKFPSYKRFYDDLFARGKLVKEFNPTELNIPGPTVKIFKL